MTQAMEDLLRSIRGIDKDSIRKRFNEQITTLEHEQTPDDIADRLFASLDVIEHTIQTSQMARLPVQTQATILQQLQKCEKNLTNASISAQSWFNQILKLETVLWQNNLFAGTVEESRLIERTAELQSALQEIESTVRKARTCQTDVEKIAEYSKQAKVQHEEISKSNKNVRNLVAQIHAHEEATAGKMKSTEEMFKGAVESKAGAEIQLKAIQQFATKVESYEVRMKSVEETSVSAREGFEEYKTKAASDFEEFMSDAESKTANSEKRLEGLLEMAVGVSLFSAFNRRQKVLMYQSIVWVALTLASMGLAIALGYNLANSIVQDVPIAAPFWIKLSTAPLWLLAIGFCASQYSSTKRLEEAYAFKSAQSVSLEPYRQLISELYETEKTGPHVDFAVDTIRQIYTSPILQSELKKGGKVIEVKTLQEIVNMVLKTMSQSH